MPLVKVISPLTPGWLEHQIPTQSKTWGECTFTFDHKCSNYDCGKWISDENTEQPLIRCDNCGNAFCSNCTYYHDVYDENYCTDCYWDTAWMEDLSSDD